MAFPPIPLYVRDDPFGPLGHNSVLQRTDHLVDSFAAEHDPMTGEHNTPHVARTLGHIAWNGASYSKSGFNSRASTLVHTATGVLDIRLDSSFRASDGIIEVQPADDTGGGDGNVWLAQARWVSDARVQVRLKKNTVSVDVQQAFAATDGDFFIGIRSSAIQNTAVSELANRRQRGQGLRVGTSDWNPAVQRLGDNRYATLQAHTSTGLHNVREVAKAWGFVKWSSAGSSYSMAAQQGLSAGVARQSQGVVRVYLGNCIPAISAPVQVFARPVSAVTATTAHTGLRCAMVPKTLCTATSVDVYLYESYVDAGPPVTYRWRRVDGDFFLRVHGA